MARNTISEKGFTLVEVLCALVIAATAVVVLLRSVTGAVEVARRIEGQLGDRILAQSVLAEER